MWTFVSQCGRPSICPRTVTGPGLAAARPAPSTQPRLVLGAASTPHTLCSVAHTTTHISHRTPHITPHTTACRPRCVWGWRARAVCPPPAPTKASPASRGPAQPSPAQHHTAVRLSHQCYAHTATSQHMTTRDGIIWQYRSSASDQRCPSNFQFAWSVEF